MCSLSCVTRYIPRVVDGALAARLRSSGAVLIEGPKACGKTFTAEQHAKSTVYLDVDDTARTALGIDPTLVLSGDPPQLVDEWQLDATLVWSHVRAEVNRRQQPGQFILTGSATPPDDDRRHSGAGRVARLRMRPMSLFETGDSTGEVSLVDLLAGRPVGTGRTDVTVDRYAEIVVRGGWPLNLGLSVASATRANIDYLTAITDVDLPRVERQRKNPRIARRLLQALARNIGMEYVVARLVGEAADGTDDIARSTAYDYLAPLERLMVVELLDAWSPHLRSRARLRRRPRIHLADPSLAVAALRSNVNQLLTDLSTFGYLFESLVIRDLRVFSDALDGTVYHYRDSDDLEVDAVVTAGDGSWGAFEIKLGQRAVDDAARTLLTFANKVDTTKIGPPSALVVITGPGYCYRRPDGVRVVPAALLGP